MTQLDRNEEVEDAEVARSSSRPAVIEAVSIEVRGTLPHPQLLSQFNDVIPDGAERIVQLTESQVRHRQVMEARGQIFTFLLAVVALLGGIVLIAVGDGANGLAPLVVAVAGLSGLFVYRELRSRSSS